MISKEKQRFIFLAMNNTNDKNLVAKVVGVHKNTVTKYIKSGKTLEEHRKKRNYATQEIAIKAEHWKYLKEKLEGSPELEATAAMDHLIEKYPNAYTGKEIRTLQRKIKKWRLEEGKDKEVMFYQVYEPGERSQSDFIHMNYLEITINGVHYKHILYHFILAYSGWEDVTVCEGGESFENLCTGYEKALWRLMGITQKHRTDNLTAAVNVSKEGRPYTEDWVKLNKYYGIEPTKNNPGKSNENGKVERSNGLFKRSLENQLMIRNSKEFKDKEEYVKFIDNIVKKRNQKRDVEVSEEKKMLRELPKTKWYSATKIPVRVHSDSTVRIESATYSVPSRTIGSTLSAYIYPDKIELFYGRKLIQKMSRIKKGTATINFLHVIDSLKRKPGAFEDYKYKENMYPTTAFRQSYDMLKNTYSEQSANKKYIELLYLAKIYSVQEVADALKLLIHKGKIPTQELVSALLINEISIPDIYVIEPDLEGYDNLFMRVN